MATIDSQLRLLLQEGRSRGLTEEEIKEVLHFVIKQEQEAEDNKCVSTLDLSSDQRDGKLYWKIRKVLFCTARVAAVLFFITMVTVAIGVIICLHNPTRKLLSRNIQDLIYPFMTAWRFITLPFLCKWPHLSNWYEEECIVQNVFFDNLNVNCEACIGVKDVSFLAKMENFTETFYNSGKPFILDLETEYPNMDELYEIVSNNHKLFISGSYFKTSPVSMEELFSSRKVVSTLSEDAHIEWQIFRMTTVQMFRTYFPRLAFIPPDTEVALRRYIFIDGKKSIPYDLPITEFSNVIVAQIEGSSSVTLEPSSTCRISTCTAMKVNLQRGQVLFYNWLYWRPVRSSCIAEDVSVENGGTVDSNKNMENKVTDYEGSSTTQETTTSIKDEFDHEIDAKESTKSGEVDMDRKSKIIFGKQCVDQDVSLVYISSFY